jgi:hypothetical protein
VCSDPEKHGQFYFTNEEAKLSDILSVTQGLLGLQNLDPLLYIRNVDVFHMPERP